MLAMKEWNLKLKSIMQCDSLRFFLVTQYLKINVILHNNKLKMKNWMIIKNV